MQESISEESTKVSPLQLRLPFHDPTAEEPAPAKCQVRRRMKAGTYSQEFDKYVGQWYDWHYYPLNTSMWAEVFLSHDDAQKYIDEQKKAWPNFEYEILDQDT